MEEELKIIQRPFNPEVDTPMIYASWRNSLFFDQKQEEEPAKFFRLATRDIRRMLSHPDCKIKVACLKSDPNFIVGYAVITKDNLDWVYVKGGAEYRKKGIASFLTKGFKTISEPKTKIGKAIAKKKRLKTKGEYYGKEENADYGQSSTPTTGIDSI